MGISFSTNSRRRNGNHHPHILPPSHLISPASSSSSAFPSFPYPSADPSYLLPPPYPYTTQAPPPPPPPPHSYSYYCPSGYVTCNYGNPLMGRPNIGPFLPYHNNGWTGFPQPHLSVVPTPLVPPPYVEHQQSRKVRNHVNVHKSTLKLDVDENNSDHYLLSFVFDALFDGSITICYFAKEEPDCRFMPLYPEVYTPVKFPFQKGIGQKFCQPSGTGIDLGFFELDDLSKPLSGENVYPLVISAETCMLSSPLHEHAEDHPSSMFPNMQITQAVLEKNNDDLFKVKVIRQVLWIDGVRYELRDIYGIGNSVGDFNESDSGKECVICMTDPKDTAILPCRHMCLCSECAKTLRLRTNKCPICRQPIEELIEIKIGSSDQREVLFL